MVIVVAGYYGFGNLGDELILSVLARQLKNTYFRPEIVVLSSRPSHTRYYHGTRAVWRWNPFSVLTQIFRADLLVLGGGGLLQDKTSFRSLLYYIGLALTGVILRKPVFLYSIGVETVQRPLSKWLLKKALSSRLIKITVRDQASADLLRSAGITDKAIFVHQDPVFSLSIDVPERKDPHSLKRILFIPRFPAPPEANILYNDIRFLVEGRLGVELDEGIFEPRVEKEFRPHAIAIETLSKMAELLAEADLVISARYHGLVLAALAGRPFIGIGDTQKVGRLCEALNMPFVEWSGGRASLEAALGRVNLSAGRRGDFLQSSRRLVDQLF
jgi:polysaccharide pyruvyl transferase CsaB